MNCTKSPLKVVFIRWIIPILLTLMLFVSLGIGEVAMAYQEFGPVYNLLPESIAPQYSNDDSGLPWLFAVFAITWASFFGYTLLMSRRQKEITRELETLKKLMLDREKDGK